MDRRIVCLRIPSFEIALARLEDEDLRTRPVAVAAPFGRAVLREVSHEAQQEGLSPGMDVDQARWLCPALRLLPPSGSRVRRGQQALQQIVSRFAPVWEPITPGHLFLDLTGTQRLFGAATDTASRIGGEIIQRHGLEAALGVGSNKLVTQVATTLVQPAELYDVRPGNERPFMAPLPPAVLPELRQRAARTLVELLQDLNLSTLGTIADVPLAQLHLVLGACAEDLHRRARGIDHTPVTAGQIRPWRMEVLTFEPDAVDMNRLRGSIVILVERLCRGLRRDQRVCRRIRVTVVHADFVEVSRETEIDPETCWEADLLPHAQDLLVRTFKRRVRVRRLILEAHIRALEHEQLYLYPASHGGRSDPDKAQRLAHALDRIRHRFGDRAVRWGEEIGS